MKTLVNKGRPDISPENRETGKKAAKEGKPTAFNKEKKKRKSPCTKILKKLTANVKGEQVRTGNRRP